MFAPAYKYHRLAGLSHSDSLNTLQSPTTSFKQQAIPPSNTVISRNRKNAYGKIFPPLWLLLADGKIRKSGSSRFLFANYPTPPLFHFKIQHLTGNHKLLHLQKLLDSLTSYSSKQKYDF